MYKPQTIEQLNRIKEFGKKFDGKVTSKVLMKHFPEMTSTGKTFRYLAMYNQWLQGIEHEVKKEGTYKTHAFRTKPHKISKKRADQIARGACCCKCQIFFERPSGYRCACDHCLRNYKIDEKPPKYRVIEYSK